MLRPRNPIFGPSNLGFRNPEVFSTSPRSLKKSAKIETGRPVAIMKIKHKKNAPSWLLNSTLSSYNTAKNRKSIGIRAAGISHITLVRSSNINTKIGYNNVGYVLLVGNLYFMAALYSFAIIIQSIITSVTKF